MGVGGEFEQIRKVKFQGARRHSILKMIQIASNFAGRVLCSKIWRDRGTFDNFMTVFLR